MKPPMNDYLELLKETAPARRLIQGILALAVSAVGLLGFAAQFESDQGSWELAIFYGVLTPLAVAGGIWLIWMSRARAKKEPQSNAPPVADRTEAIEAEIVDD
jgi:hypothetical protein